LERLVARRVRTLTGILVLVVGVGDQGQAAQTLNDRYGSVATELAALSTFVTSLERVLPADAMVLQLPFRTYMSEGDFGRMKQYDHYKPYLVSHQLRFSYPAMSNQQVRWQQAMSRLDARTLAARASAAGFAAILLDRYGYEDGGAALSAALLRVVGEARILASTGRFLVFDISALANEALDVATLEPIPLTLALPPCGREPLMQIDQIGETHGPIPSSGVQLAAGREFKVSGWAVDHPQQAPASGVDVTIDRTVFPTSYGLHRGDVADAYRFASYRETGFSATLPAGVLTAGEHWLSVRVVAAAGTCYYQGRNVRVTVK
jgi:hypothetical protein